MENKLNLPSWSDVGMSEVFVQNLRTAPPSTVEMFYFDRVTHTGRKHSYRYHCGVCGHTHKPNKLTDDYSICDGCKSRCICLTAQLKPLVGSGGVNLTDALLGDATRAMTANYANYFGNIEVPDDLVKFGWKQKTFRVQFLGGEEVEGVQMGVTVARAALLTPFIWDTSYDWKEHRHMKHADQCTYISPIFYDICNYKLRGPQHG